MNEFKAQQRLGEIGLDNFAPYLMNRIMGRYNASLRAEMMQHGLTTPKFRSLAVLAMIDGILIGELSVYAVVEHSTLTRALDGLEKEGLALRRPDPDDARATRIYITPEGRRLFEELWPRMAAFYAEMFKDIPEGEQRAFTATLQKILKNIRIHDF